MSRLFLSFIVVIVLSCFAFQSTAILFDHANSNSKTTTTSLPIWPKPVSSTFGSSQVTISSKFHFIQSNTDNVTSERLTKAFHRYESRIKKQSSSTDSESTGLTSCKVIIATVYPDSSQEVNTLDLDMDESYSIDISDSSSCTIKANTIWGGMNALETFSQLLQVDKTSQTVVMPYSPVTISDYPRYSHRGLLIDTSRHYLPVDTIYSLISSLPMSKINVLHWHMVDAESFPFNSVSEPTMVDGAYQPSMTYTTSDVAAITSFAADRGIRVLFEIDIPGHSGSWVDGKPEILADCLTKYSNVENYALNPSLDETYSTINGIISDLVTSQAPYNTKYVHLGGDEVVYGCWSNDKSITTFMAEQGIKSYDGLLSYFVNRTDTMIQTNIKPDTSSDKPMTMIHWEEVYFAGAVVPDNTIYQVWTDATKMALVADGGHNIIASPSDYWYLNYVKIDWQTMYSYEPTSNLTSSQSSLLIGGEACVWGEMVDGVNLEAVVYPRLSAVSERLWSPITTTDQSDAKTRLTVQHCRLEQHGYKSAAVQPDYCAIQYI